MREVVIPVTFKIGDLSEIGIGGFKTGWVDAEEDGTRFSLTSGAGRVYAMANITEVATALWNEMRNDLPGGEKDAGAAETNGADSQLQR